MNGSPRTPRFKLFYSSSKGRIFGSEKMHAKYFSKRGNFHFFYNQGRPVPPWPLAQAALPLPKQFFYDIHALTFMRLAHSLMKPCMLGYSGRGEIIVLCLTFKIDILKYILFLFWFCSVPTYY